MRGPRKDDKGRELRRGESQIKNGSYVFRYFDEMSGQRKSITSWRLLPEDESPDPTDERDCLRNIEIRIEDFQRKYRRKRFPKAKCTFNDFWERYLSTKCEIAESTLVGYIYTYNRQIRPDLGDRLVTALRESDIKRFYIKKLGEDGLSLAYVESIANIVEPILELAVKEGYIFINPAKGVIRQFRRRKDLTPKVREALTEKEQSNLVDFVAGSYELRSFLPYLTVLLGTGVRAGELLGLTWDDIDFDDNTVNIDHTLSYDVSLSGKTEYYITYPKSRRSIRKIPMLKEVRETFEELYRRRDDFNKDYQPIIDGYTGFIFRDLKGNVLNNARLNRALKKAVKEYNAIEEKKASDEKRRPELLPDITCHHLRHTFCTRLVEAGASIKSVQYLMGHSYAGTTVKIYLSITEARNKEEMSKLEGVMKLR